ncbi:MAG: VWA domain-containing protein [Planctomycetaceae bacterium]|jgi:hypothetical protein|nr:VWA domain-containing protein [Planctomycetaceae bacterium]
MDIMISLSRRALVGSLLFHLFLLLFFLLFFRFQPERVLLTDGRDAAGKILIKRTVDDAVQYEGVDGVEFKAADADAADLIKSESEILAGRFTDFAPLSPPERIGLGAANIMSKSSDSGVWLFGLQDVNNPITSADADNTNPSGISGGSKRLRVFNVQAAGNNFVFVFDKSTSMNERNGIPFKAAKLELLRNIAELDKNEKCKFNIIFYNDEFHQWSDKGMLPATELNCKNATAFVQLEEARGGTNHYEPLIAAIKQKPDVIFFLTDGDENDAIRQTQLKEIKRINQINKIQINVIQFGIGKDRASDFLQQLAHENNGLYSYINVLELRE